ncbi:MAG: F-type H+-transporting ATPase subunit delta [Verrucomicrobia bacterium]|nr:F-type H+-transporting ATPase subunit delta [Verrucomicrobiota bacterium]
MKIGKQARRDAKQLFLACKANGLLDENRVRQAVNEVIAKKPRGYVAALQHFQRLVKLDIERRAVRVEDATETSPDLKASIKANLEKRYGPGLHVEFAVNPALIGGLRIKVGSDVYDGSVVARLNALQEAI